MDEFIYKLSIHAAGEWHNIHASKSELEPVINDWHELGDVGGRLRVEGITDTCDRAPITLVLDRSTITAMTLLRLY